jgi:hypothetical protein
VEVVLEPQGQPVAARERLHQAPIAVTECGEGRFRVESEPGGQESGALGRQLVEEQPGRHRSLVEHVAPGQDGLGRDEGRDLLGRGVAIGHV